jgi:spore coat polysaccharide biosynthesis protein SpsF
MGSSRLPNKMLLHLHGYPICEWVFRRVQQAKKINQVVFALPNTKNDDALAWYLQSIGANLFRGSEMDLVERYYQAAKQIGADRIVRICADNPLICATEIDRLVDFFEHESCDYAYNHIPKENGYPDGLGAEICSIQLLEEIQLKANSPENREHLFNTIWDNRVDYNIKTFDPVKEIAHPELKLDLDTTDDYQQLLEKPYRIDMSAIEIVQTALQPKANSIK